MVDDKDELASRVRAEEIELQLQAAEANRLAPVTKRVLIIGGVLLLILVTFGWWLKNGQSSSSQSPPTAKNAKPELQSVAGPASAPSAPEAEHPRSRLVGVWDFVPSSEQSRLAASMDKTAGRQPA